MALHLQGNDRPEEETSKAISLFLEKNWWNWSCKFSKCFYGRYCSSGGFCCTADFFLYDIDNLDGSMKVEHARRSVVKLSNTVRLLRYNSYFCNVSIINALFKTYRYPSCDQFIKTVQHLVWYLTTCKERVEHVLPKNMYQLRETLFDKLDSFNVPYFHDQKLFKILAIFDFKSIRMQEGKFRDTDTTLGLTSTFQ